MPGRGSKQSGQGQVRDVAPGHRRSWGNRALAEHGFDAAPGGVLNSCLPIAEHLDAMVLGVRDIDVATCINHDTPGIVKLAGLAAVVAPLCDVVAAAGEHLDAAVVGVRDVDVATGINRDTAGVLELPRPRARSAPLEDVATTVGEHLDAMVLGVRDIDVANGINRDT